MCLCCLYPKAEKKNRQWIYDQRARLELFLQEDLSIALKELLTSSLGKEHSVLVFCCCCCFYLRLTG